MQRLLGSLVLTGLWLCCGLGCTSTFEARAISKFTEALEDADLDRLRETSSSDFKDVVLRREDALDALKQINLPEGETKVKKIEEIDDDTKRVLAEVGEKKRKLIFTLTRDPETRHWVVDDIHVKPSKKKAGKVNLSVQQQMDLLLTIREFLDAWGDGDRDRVLESTTPSLALHLGKLPPASLAKLAKTVAGQTAKKTGLRPEVEGHKDAALVRIQRKTGEIVLSLRLVGTSWKADDVQVISKHEKDNLPSLRKLTSVMIAAVAFYDAYQAQDKDALKLVCTKEFYGNSLSIADLGTVKLPEVDIRNGELDVSLQKTRAVVMLKREGEVVQLSLVQDLPKDEEGEAQAREAEDNMSMVPFQIEEATLYELETKQEKRLSALFTGQAIMQIFSEALVTRDLHSLKHSASQDFNNRVWNRVTATTLSVLPLESIEAVPPRIEEILFKGPITEMVVTQGKHPLTYILRDQAGRLVVDDVEFPALDRPNSLKATLEVMLPVYEFMAGLEAAHIPQLKNVATRDFNKAVWNQLDKLPELPLSTGENFRAPLTRIELSAEHTLVVLGDNRWGAKVFMTREEDQYKIDDVMLISGIEHQERVAMKQYLRSKLLKVTSTKETKAKPALPRQETNEIVKELAPADREQ